MRKKALHVTLDVREPSEIEVTVGEKVQLDRLVRSRDRYVAERCGDLLHPGMTTLALEQGQYLLKTLSDVHLKVVCGGTDITTDSKDKDIPPDPKVVSKGDGLSGPMPTCTIE